MSEDNISITLAEPSGDVDSFSAGDLKRLLEGLLLVSDTPLSIARICEVLGESAPEPGQIKFALEQLACDCTDRAVELKEVASGYRYQLKSDCATWVSRLWAVKPVRLSRALLETLALVAYQQPITRAEIEDIRGVSVGSGVLKTLVERGWVKAIGHRDVPGKPAVYATTREFLDYFNLKSIRDLPALPVVSPDFSGELPEAETASSNEMPGNTAMMEVGANSTAH